MILYKPSEELWRLKKYNILHFSQDRDDLCWRQDTPVQNMRNVHFPKPGVGRVGDNRNTTFDLNERICKNVSTLQNTIYIHLLCQPSAQSPSVNITIVIIKCTGGGGGGGWNLQTTDTLNILLRVMKNKTNILRGLKMYSICLKEENPPMFTPWCSLAWRLPAHIHRHATLLKNVKLMKCLLDLFYQVFI